MLIRQALESEATNLANLYIKSFKEALPTINLVHNDKEIKNWFNDYVVAECDTWVATEGTKLLGFIALEKDTILKLYVDSASQGLGIGQKLIQKAKKLHPQGLKAYVFQINKPARKFYEKHDFVATEYNNGSRNEENEPDILYVWRPL